MKKTFVILLLTVILAIQGAMLSGAWFIGEVIGCFFAALVIVELSDRLLQRIKQRIKS